MRPDRFRASSAIDASSWEYVELRLGYLEPSQELSDPPRVDEMVSQATW